MNHHGRYFATMALPLVLILLTGCGGGTGPRMVPVSGKVLFADGGVVRSGTVELTSADHQFTARGRIGTDGSFRLGTVSSDDGAVVGKHRAIVTQLVPVEDVASSNHAPHGLVHEKYADYATSGLTVEIPANGTRDLVITVSQGALQR
jgi:hypothetical protein